jgi:HTH-type transcriptional regulator/antitoxin HigA
MRRDMLPVFGHRSHASEVLTRRRKLSLSMIRALVFDFGMPAECLIQDYDLVHGGSEND